ncbi:MAG: HD domain-containing phosphohydrolase [Halanaerobium sp.]
MRKIKKLKEEYKVTIIYLFTTLVWIYFSDNLLMLIAENIEQYNQLQTYKGILFVIITAGIFFGFMKKYIGSLREQKNELRTKSKELKSYNKKMVELNEEINESFNEIKDLNERFLKMVDLFSNTNYLNHYSEDEFMQDILKTAIEVVKEADYGTVYKYKDGKVKFIDSVGYNLESLQQIDISAEAFFNKNGSIERMSFEDINDKKAKYMDAASYNNFQKEAKKIKENICFDLEIKGKKKGGLSLDIAKESSQRFNKNSEKIFRVFYNITSIFYNLEEYNYLQNSFTKELIASIINILEMYDYYTRGHSENVARLALLTAEEMGLSDQEVLDTYWAGMVHDIGKLLVPVQILNKTEKLNDVEYELIKKHPVWSSKALADSQTLEHISEYVLYHHERWDGNGYPEGLKGDEIPLISQIIAVADAWDAMTSDRSYRDALSRKKACQEIKKNRGKQFAPEVVDNFVHLLESNKLDLEERAAARFNKLEKLTQEESREDYFKKLFEKSKEGTVILDEQFAVINANQTFREMFGFENDEIIGEELKNMLSPAEKKEEMEKHIEELKQGKEIVVNTYRRRKDGERITVNVQAFPISIKENEIKYYVIYSDISELEKAKRKYDSYRNRYRTLFENESTVMLIIDPENGSIVDANPAAVDFYGWSKEELTSMQITEINQLSQSEVKEEMERAKRENKKHFNFKHRVADGKIKDVEVYSQPIDFDEDTFLYSIIYEKNNVGTGYQQY